MDAPWITSRMAARLRCLERADSRDGSRRSDRPPMTPIISLTGVTKSFKGHVAVDDLSFSVRSGEIVTLLGQTGAGKSTILHLILGQIAPTAGKVLVAGYDPVRESNHLRGILAVSFQSDRLIP